MKKKISIIVAIIIALFLALALFTSCEKKEIIKTEYIQKELGKVKIKYEVIASETDIFFLYQDSVGVINHKRINDTIFSIEFHVLPESFYYIDASVNPTHNNNTWLIFNMFKNDSLIITETATGINSFSNITLSGQLPK